MRLVSATDVAIALALRCDTLRIVERDGRFGAYWSIEDDRGVIEVHLSSEDASTRIATIRERL